MIEPDTTMNREEIAAVAAKAAWVRYHGNRMSLTTQRPSTSLSRHIITSVIMNFTLI